MVNLDERQPYSYRDDPDVPAFDDSGPIVFMDGACTLCSAGARLISRFDRAREFRICTVQSPLGTAILRHYGIDTGDPETWLYLADGRAHTSLDAIIRAGDRLGGVARMLLIFRIFPRSVQDWLYRSIARNRYSLFGRTEMCTLPDPELRKRLMQ